MILRHLTPPSLRTFAAALRAGEPVLLATATSSLVPLDEIVPLCHDICPDRCHAALRPLLPPAASGAPGPAVTAILPSSRGLPLGLSALLAQDLPMTVRVLSNGAGGPPAGSWVERVAWKGHGRTRREAIATVTTPYVLLTVDDAIVMGAGMVRRMVEVLERGGYDAVVARQVPWPDADPVTRRRLRAWTPPPTDPLSPTETPSQPSSFSVSLDHVCALHRRDLLLADPLDDVPTGEDWRWGRRHHVGYASGAVVLHSHVRTFRASFSRTRDLHRVFAEAGEPPTVPDTPSLLRALPGVLGRDVRGALGELLGQWAGGRGGGGHAGNEDGHPKVTVRSTSR